MSNWLGFFALPAAVFLSSWFALCVLASVTFRAVAAPTAMIEPAQRAVILLAIALAPVAVGGLVTFVVFMPALGGTLVDTHCHGASCAPHVPTVTMQGRIGMSLALAVTAMTATALAVLLHALSRTIGLGRMLLAIAGRRCHDYDVLDTDTPGAWCVGLVRSRVLVTRGLIERLPPSKLTVVLAHEQGHMLRWDNLRHFVAGATTIFMPRATRRRLLAALRLAAEHACDRIAVAHVGCRREVAETLATVAAACLPTAPGQTASAFQPDTVRQRLAALDSDAYRSFNTFRMSLAMASAYALLTVAGAGLAHHALELLPALRAL